MLLMILTAGSVVAVWRSACAGEQKSLTKSDRYPLRRLRKGFLAKCQTLSDKKCGDSGGKFITSRCAAAGVLPQPAGKLKWV